MVATKNQLEFEDLLEEIGEFGSFQKKMLVNFLAPVSIALPVLVMNILFLVNTPDHHCYIPEVASNNLTFDVQKTLFSHDKATCYMYDLNYTEWLKTNSSHVPTNTSILPCNKGWEYDTAHFEETATSKWNMVCGDSHYTNLALTLTNIGSAVGTFIYGVLGDEKRRTAFDQVSEFDRGRIVAYRNCGLSFREIGSRVGRNQTTVIRICGRWMQEGTTDRSGRSHPPQFTTSREDRKIVRMAVTDRSVTSRNIAHHIESCNASFSVCTYHSTPFTAEWSVRKMSIAWSTLDAEPQTSPRQWCDERRMWAAEWNEVVFTDESRICLQHSDGRIRVLRQCGERMMNSCVMHRHIGPVPGIMGLATAIFQQDNARPHVARVVQRFFVNHQIELLPWPARSPYFSPIENMWSMVAQRMTQITPPAATRDQLWQCVEAAWSAESMPRHVAAGISNNGGYSGC
ncbi:carcinine transporter [Trichonephila clavipes]|nr:carcinine transporter [Trichonephila clavipes]